MAQRWKAQLAMTAFKEDQFPPQTLPEVAFVGRSNVGKSMLLNALMERKLAHVGSTPGKTRSVNFYKIEAEVDFFLVDLPGYGYAARGFKEKEKWAKLIEQYITQRETLQLLVHLVDFRHGLLKNDQELQEWISQIGIPSLVVFTKADKISKGRHKGMLHSYIRKGLKSIEVPFIVSAQDKSGVGEFRQLLTQYLNRG